MTALLLAEPEPAVRGFLERQLRNDGFDVVSCERAEQLPRAADPDVLVLDEPSSALDPAARRELADVLASLRITTLVVTHDLPYALELCPRAVVLDRGIVVADGPTREVLADEGFMRSHRLELPAGFNPLSA